MDRSAQSAQSAELLFACLLDAPNWPKWSGHDSGAVDLRGNLATGVGEVRRFVKGKSISVERIIGADAPTTFSYELISGLPVKNYRAVVTLIPRAEGGCMVNWHSTFQGKLPLMGGLMRLALGKFIGAAAKGLAGYMPVA